MSWRETTLGEITDLKRGFDLPKSQRLQGDVPVYSSSGITGSNSTAAVEGPCVITGRYGTIGEVFFSGGPCWPLNTALYSTEFNGNNPRFVYYLLQTIPWQGYTTASAVPGVNRNHVNLCPVKIPDKATQDAIVEVLDSIVDKIALNNQLNDYLFELVSSVFAHRFSDNVNTTELKNVLSISTKALKPQEHADEIWEHYSIPAFDEKHRPIFEPASGIKSNKYQIDSECILISKLNPSTKRIWMPCCSSNNAVCSTEFIVYRPYLKEYKSFYYAAIDSPRFTDYLLEHVSGSTGSRQRAQPKDTLNYLMPNPDNEEIKDFCIFADPIYRHIQINEQQTAKLELLRETLLPKLMSGTIDVSKVDLTQLTNNHLADC
ncbi:type I restriction-modification system specificity determinant [Bifidobacterium longum subsp. longum]|uniref:restriction endonuclease subunit S n=1 Tax=Bifidobacterium longum TaxID=216816 RepID=UPI0007214F71|nr:restriction endonuclease subunit S [Bifidobacterium longum]ALO73023.1 type I restriction-modification system specificity determinant [Bifidobacterium longum subsp. longum]